MHNINIQWNVTYSYLCTAQLKLSYLPEGKRMHGDLSAKVQGETKKVL